MYKQWHGICRVPTVAHSKTDMIVGGRDGGMAEGARKKRKAVMQERAVGVCDALCAWVAKQRHLLKRGERVAGVRPLRLRSSITETDDEGRVLDQTTWL